MCSGLSRAFSVRRSLLPRGPTQTPEWAIEATPSFYSALKLVRASERTSEGTSERASKRADGHFSSPLPISNKARFPSRRLRNAAPSSPSSSLSPLLRIFASILDMHHNNSDKNANGANENGTSIRQRPDNVISARQMAAAALNAPLSNV